MPKRSRGQVPVIFHPHIYFSSYIKLQKKNQTAKEFIQKLFFINNCFELIATKLIPYAFYLIFESLPFINMLSS